MTKYRNVGPDRRDEVAPQRARHDMRRTGVKLKEVLRTPVGGLMVLFVMGVIAFALPAMADLMLLTGAGSALFIKSAQATYTLPAKMPKHCGLIDPAELNPKGVAQRAAGAFFLGNDRVTMEEVWLSNRDAGVHMLVLGTTGSGKALRLDEPVLTPDGFKLMRHIKVGDLVMHQSGKPTRVIGVFPQGALKLHRITFADGRFMDVSGDHLWEVHELDPGIGKRVLTTFEVAGALRNDISLSVPLFEPNYKEAASKTLPNAPYLLGEKLREVTELTGPRTIPQAYFDAPAIDRLNLIRGLMDGDGDVGIDGCPIYSTTSLQLSVEVARLLRSIGAVVTTSTNSPGSEYHLVIRMQDASKLFHLQSKRHQVLRLERFNVLRLGIVSVEELDREEECQCIKVEAEDGLFVAGDYVVTHNTEMLLGLCQNALNQGSGFMFVDGKAQDKIAFKIQDLCRARGRDDDVLVLNFMTGARDIIGPQPNKITNTMNPFSYGSSGMVSQLVVGLMASGGGGDDMWKDRAISFVEALSPPLCYLRDNCGLILDVNEFRKYFSLEKLEELCWKGAEKYPGLHQVLDPMSNYLLNLPGYDKAKFGKRGGQGDDTNLQHGYITMQLVRAFTSLADTYGHIVRVPLGEVYFPDLVKQRRILIAMLPSLEKTPSETANIGKIIVTALRNIMAEGLGSTLEGNRDDLDNDEGKALLPPYVVILDEYGYYAVKGFAVAFAQARSLGFVCIVGGQDLASFQRESKEEAVSICGNTRLKAFGSIEDPDQTMDFAVKTAGKALVAEASGYEGDVGMMGTSYRDSLNIHLKSLERIDPSDVKEQKEGQFHFVIGSKVVRAQTYYVNPKKVKRVQLNHFLQVPPPTKLQLDQLEMQSSGLADRLATIDLSMLSVPAVREIDAAAAVLAEELFQRLRPIDLSIAAIVRVGVERERHLQSFRKDVTAGGGEGASELYRRIAESGSESIAEMAQRPGTKASAAPAPAAASRITRADPDEFDASSFLQSVPNSGDDDEDEIDAEDADLREAAAAFAQQAATSNPDFRDPSAALEAAVAQAPDIDDEDVRTFATVSVFLPPAQSTSFGADVFAEESEVARRVEQALTGPDDATPLLNMQATIAGVESIERQLGASNEEAGAAARMVVKQIEDSTRYPQSIPAQKTTDQITGMLGELVGLLEGD